MFTNEICPYRSHTDHSYTSCDTFHDSAAGDIDILAFEKEELMEELLLTHLEVIEQPPGSYALTGGRLDDPEVLPYPDVIPDATVVRPSDPFLADKLAVCDKTVNAVGPKETYEPFQSLLALLAIGVASLGKKTEYQREGNSFIGYAQHEDIDVELSEFPVGTIYAEQETGLDRKQRKNHTGYDVEVNNILG